MVLVWEQTGVPGGNQRVRLSDNMTISHADAWYETWVAAVRGEPITTSSLIHLITTSSLIHLITTSSLKLTDLSFVKRIRNYPKTIFFISILLLLLSV